MDGIFLTTELLPTGGRTTFVFRISLIPFGVQSIFFICPMRAAAQAFAREVMHPNRVVVSSLLVMAQAMIRFDYGQQAPRGVVFRIQLQRLPQFLFRTLELTHDCQR